MAKLVFTLDEEERDRLVMALLDSDHWYNDPNGPEGYECSFCGLRNSKHLADCDREVLIAFFQNGKEA